jgi:hypothetical protein
MKKILILTGLFLISGLLVFASGNQEAQKRWADEEPATITGQLILQENQWPQLESGGQVYELMYPPFIDLEIDVQDGQQITIEGYVIERPYFKNEEYIIPMGRGFGHHMRAPRGFMGRGYWGRKAPVD